MRSRDERYQWHQMNVPQQLQVMKLCARRYQRVLERKRARAEGDVNLELNFAEVETKTPQFDLI